ncbi:MAG: ParA family partition ATPase [Gammaproteobacteria bacterium]
MPVFAVVGNKGGAGKTTLSVNIASALARHTSVALVDADPQGSSLQWRAFAENDSTIPVYEAGDELGQQARDLLKEYEYVMFDCPPSVLAPQTTTVLGFCELALIPVQPSPIDLWATVHIENAVDQALKTNPGLRALLIINQLETRTTLSRLAREALSEIGLPIANTALRRRAIYRNSALEGKSVFDMGRRGADAAAELEQLIQEMLAE